MELIFEWDVYKAQSNLGQRKKIKIRAGLQATAENDQNPYSYFSAVALRRHGVSFEEAKTVFNDPLLLTYPDDFHSETEERLISIG